jgi:EAL domain-containing protein (putative c-di-GMP-specific phosphodiesterase class I)
LLLHYQPRLHLSSRQITGVEALARWQHPTRGLIMPSDFIPLAAGRRLLSGLTDWAFRTAVRQAQAWKQQGIEPTIAVNLSAADVFEYDRPDQMAAVCVEHGVEPKKFIFELTETDVMSDPVRLMDVFTRLRLKGFELAIDDFGSGYSSLVQLVRLPFSELKIDMSFVSSMLHSEDSRIVVETVIGMGKNLRMVTVAEGVESALALAALQTMNCDYAQGYHISRPVVAEQIPPMIVESWTASAPN